MLRSIRWRLVASYVLLAVLAVSVVGVLAFTLTRQSLEQQEIATLTSNAEAIANQALPRMTPLVRLAELDQLAQAAAFLGNVRVRILDNQQQTVLADSGPSDQFGEVMWIAPESGEVLGFGKITQNGVIVILPSGEKITLPAGAAFTAMRRVNGPYGGQLQYNPSAGQAAATQAAGSGGDNAPAQTSSTTVRVPVGPQARPIGYVELSGGPNFNSQALATLQAAFLWAALAAALAAALVGLVVSRGLTAPLVVLGKAANQMSLGDLSARAPVTTKDELGQLGGQFNQMAERLQGSFNQLAAERDALRRFVADASHELRTPITALQTFTDLLQGPADADPQARIQFLAESQVQLARLEWITHNLLDLSRLDAGIETLDTSPQDAGELTQAAVSPFKPQARDKDIALALDLPEQPLEVLCDRARLEMALSNLVQNALKFTPCGGWVQVRLEAVEGGVRWTVADSGPGISEEDQAHIFERFYRGGQVTGEGSGLGLAIVKSIVQAHGGQVGVESKLGEGSKFTIELLNNP